MVKLYLQRYLYILFYVYKCMYYIKFRHVLNITCIIHIRILVLSYILLILSFAKSYYLLSDVPNQTFVTRGELHIRPKDYQNPSNAIIRQTSPDDSPVKGNNNIIVIGHTLYTDWQWQYFDGNTEFYNFNKYTKTQR